MELDWQKATKLDQYLAAIRLEIARSRAKDPGSLKLTDYLLKFAHTEPEKPLTKKEQLELRKQKAAASKAAWMAIAEAGSARTKKK